MTNASKFQRTVGQKTLADSLPDEELAMHIHTALSTPSGRILFDYLRVECHMVPGPQMPWGSAEEAVSQHSRRNLFLMLEHYRQAGRNPSTK